MVEFDFLYRGLCGMANAPRAGSMAGHLGAAVMAGYFFGEDHPDLEAGVYSAIERDLNRITGGEESIWFDPKKAGITAAELFAPLPKEPARTDLTDKIATALSRNIGETRQSGHNVIFASVAIRALRDHKQFATPKLVGGIEKLIGMFDAVHAGRGYYGKKIGWKNGKQAPVAEGADLKNYSSAREMAETVISELIQSASQHRQGFGGLFHLMNHAAALTELERFGYAELARKGLSAHRHHLLLYRALPDLEGELGKLETTNADPLKAGYWKKTESRQWGAWLTHRIKTLYGFHTLLRFVEDKDKRARALKQFGYLMA